MTAFPSTTEAAPTLQTATHLSHPVHFSASISGRTRPKIPKPSSSNLVELGPGAGEGIAADFDLQGAGVISPVKASATSFAREVVSAAAFKQ